MLRLSRVCSSGVVPSVLLTAWLQVQVRARDAYMHTHLQPRSSTSRNRCRPLAITASPPPLLPPSASSMAEEPPWPDRISAVVPTGDVRTNSLPYRPYLSRVRLFWRRGARFVWYVFTFVLFFVKKKKNKTYVRKEHLLPGLSNQHPERLVLRSS